MVEGEKMKVYSITRYKITPELRKAIKNHPYSMRKMSKLLGFEVKNIYFTNISVREDHLQKLNFLLNLDLNLEEIKFDFTKNLGINAFMHPIKQLKESEKLAEFIGIMLGDGNIWKNQIRIAFDKRNIKYIDYVDKLFKGIVGLRPKRRILEKTNQAYLYFYSRDFVNKLIEFGLKRGSKIGNQIGIPNWIKENKIYAKACVRGLIDTDGCIYRCKREKQTYIKFTNFNKKLLSDFKEQTKTLGYSFAKANKNNWCLYRKAEVAKFIKDVKPLKFVFGAVGQSV